MKNEKQADDIKTVFGLQWKNLITQGEQVAILWKTLFEQFGIHFDFAYRTFRWDGEADVKAHVHCVIIGFSALPCNQHKTSSFAKLI